MQNLMQKQKQLLARAHTLYVPSSADISADDDFSSAVVGPPTRCQVTSGRGSAQNRTSTTASRPVRTASVVLLPASTVGRPITSTLMGELLTMSRSPAMVLLASQR